MHNFADGVCTLRGEADPSYEKECTHTYKNGVCKACGKDDPDYIPADGGRSLYKDIVDDYVYIITYKNNTE